MNINSLYLIIAVLLCGLLAWGGYSLSAYPDRQLYVLAAMFVSLCITSICGLSIQYEDQRSGVMIKTACWISFAVLLIMDYIFAFYHFNIPLFIICNGVISLISILVVNGIYKTHL
jgi:hypothetical protein